MENEILAVRTTNAQAMHSDISATALGLIKVIRRNGTLASFDPNKIAIAMTKAFLAVEGTSAADSNRIHETVMNLVHKITGTFIRRLENGGTIHIEDIQDQVELSLMRGGEHKVARAYVLYREERRKAREEKEVAAATAPQLHVTLNDGKVVPLDFEKLTQLVQSACEGLDEVSVDYIIEDTRRNLFDKVPMKEVSKALIMSVRVMIEKEPNYSYVAARLLSNDLNSEALSFLGMQAQATFDEMKTLYSSYFKAHIERGVQLELLDPRLKEFDLKKNGGSY